MACTRKERLKNGTKDGSLALPKLNYCKKKSEVIKQIKGPFCTLPFVICGSTTSIRLKSENEKLQKQRGESTNYPYQSFYLAVWKRESEPLEFRKSKRGRISGKIREEETEMETDYSSSDLQRLLEAIKSSDVSFFQIKLLHTSIFFSFFCWKITSISSSKFLHYDPHNTISALQSSSIYTSRVSIFATCVRFLNT